MNARELALRVVRDVFPPPESGQRARGAQESLEYRCARSNPSGRDRAFATELAYGAIKMRRALDWQLEPFLGERLATIPAAVAEILRLGAFEIAFTQADAHATVFEFVNLAKRYGHRGLGNLVNAILRNLLREPRGLPQANDFADFADYLATRYSLPNWIVRRWSDAFGDLVEGICAAVNEPAQSALVVNQTTASRDEVEAELRAAGVVTSQSPLSAHCLLVDRGAATVHALESNAQERWWVQSESSSAVAEVLDPHPGEAILDLCSGRGNKALQLCAALAGEGSLTCIERSPAKVALLTARLGSAGFAAAVVTGDASGDVLPAEAQFDRVLLDAPCSGIGLVGRHPEMRWKKDALDAERLAMTQRALLRRAARYVRERGTLVYAVCSNDTRETTDAVEWLLQHEDVRRSRIAANFAHLQTVGGDIAIPPGVMGRDGFFIARLERR